MKLKIDCEYTNDMSMPLGFLEHHLVNAPPIYVVIYLFVFSKAKENKSLSYEDIASNFEGVVTGDIEKCFNYWSNKKIINITDNTLTFLKISMETNNSGFKNTVQIDHKPTYKTQELEIFRKNNKDVERLFTLTENILGNLLKSTDINTIFSFYDWLRLPVEVIEFLLEYSAKSGHANMRYMEKIALSWHDKGIDTLEKAKEEVGESKDDNILIKKALGIKNRDITTIETKLINKWKSEYNYNIDIILEACDKTIMQAPKPTFKYVDKILSNWYISDVKTLDDIIMYETSHFNKKEQKSATPAKTTSTNKFKNFNQKSLDFDKIEKMAQEKLNNLVKGDNNE